MTEPAKFDVNRIRADFPILEHTVKDRPLIYFDNAATAQKPAAVIHAISDYYTSVNANVHRGVHDLSQRATEAYEGAREKIRAFINAADSREIILTRGTTEGINLVARSFGGKQIKEGDEVVISTLEHHSNIVPWQLLCEEKGAALRVIPMTDDGELLFHDYEALLNDRTRLVSILHVSNALGTIVPVRKMIEAAHARDIPILVDGAQAVPHMAIDVQELDCDFYVFSGHKLYGPTGIGVLYGKSEYLETMPPYQSGGDMISTVTFERTTYNDLPYKFEAGTPNIAGTVGLGAAIDYVRAVGLNVIADYEHELVTYATEALTAIPGVELFGNVGDKAAVVSFLLEGVHAHDIGTFLDHSGIAIRAGHHCTQPLMQRLGVAATARASFAFYNTTEEIDRLATELPSILEVFS